MNKSIITFYTRVIFFLWEINLFILSFFIVHNDARARIYKKQNLALLLAASKQTLRVMAFTQIMCL